jgi:Fic family protein
MKANIHRCLMTPKTIGLLARIAELVGVLEGIKLQKPSPTLRHSNRIQTIHASLAIEGNSLTRGQVTAILDNKPVIGPRQDIAEVKNAIRVYKTIDALDPLSLDDFLNAHSVLMEGLATPAGHFRKGPIGVLRQGDIFHEAPPWQQVGSMMRTLFAYLETTEDHWVLQSCRFHFELECIHPFIDGNGRMGRLWQTVLLMQYHPIFEFLPVEDYIKANQNAYYRELAAGEDSGDCSGFVLLMLELIRVSLENLIDTTQSVTLTPNERLEIAAHSIGKASFSRKEYLSVFKTISTATASRDLQQGVKTGLLHKNGDKRLTRYRFEK